MSLWERSMFSYCQWYENSYLGRKEIKLLFDVLSFVYHWLNPVRFDFVCWLCLGIHRRKMVNRSTLLFLRGTRIEVTSHSVPQSPRRIQLSLFSVPILVRSNGAQLERPAALLSMCPLSKYIRSKVIGYGYSNCRILLLNNRTRKSISI